MLMSCTAVAICQMQTAWMLWRIHTLVTGPEPMTRTLLMWAAAISLMVLGLAESALDWKFSVKRRKEDPDDGPEDTGMAHTGTHQPYPVVRPDSPSDYVDSKKGGGEEGDNDGTAARPPPLKRTMSVYTEADEAQGKSFLRFMHMAAAFAVVGFNVAAQWIGPYSEARLGSLITVNIGLFAFIIFCIMQWLSGANDDFIPDSLAPFKASAVAYTFCACLRPICYCPVCARASTFSTRCVVMVRVADCAVWCVCVYVCVLIAWVPERPAAGSCVGDCVRRLRVQQGSEQAAHASGVRQLVVHLRGGRRVHRTMRHHRR